MNARPRVILTILLFIITNVTVFFVTRTAGSQLSFPTAIQERCDKGLCKINTTISALSDSKIAFGALNDKQAVSSKTVNQIQYIDTANSQLIKMAQENKLLFGLAIWFVGFMLAFTPCVLPLIILITGFLSQTNEISYTRSILLAITYVMSLSVTFAIIGVLAASFGIYLGVYFQNPWILGSFSLLLAILALSLLGFYKIRLPFVVQLIAARHNKLQSNYQFFEVAVMGVFATLITSPCIAAPLVGVLCYIGQSKDILLGASTLFVFGMGIGAPLLLAIIINKGILPHDKTWQPIIKFTFGILMFGVAIWISSRIIPTGMNMLLWSLLVVFSANYILSMKQNEVIDSYLLLWKSVGIILLTYGVMIFVGYLMGNKMPSNPLVLNQVMYVKPNIFSQISSIYSMNNAIQNAKSVNKPVIVLFSADWCSECQELKAQMLNDQQIQDKLDKYILLEVNVSVPGSPEQSIAKQYNIAGTPEIIFFDTAGELSNKRVVGSISANDLDAILIMMRR